MKNTSLMLLICSAFLSACDKSPETEIAAEQGSDTGSSISDDVSTAVSNAGEALSSEMQNAVDTAKEVADELAVSAKESATVAAEAVADMSEAAVEKTGEMLTTVTGDTADQGESIYKSSCFACHGSGVAGAPKLGDKAAWESRLAQGNAILSQHAIDGYKGDTGYMPPKGGYSNLSDDDVTRAVEYMVSQVQ